MLQLADSVACVPWMCHTRRRYYLRATCIASIMHYAPHQCVLTIPRVVVVYFIASYVTPVRAHLHTRRRGALYRSYVTPVRAHHHTRRRRALFRRYVDGSGTVRLFSADTTTRTSYGECTLSCTQLTVLMCNVLWHRAYVLWPQNMRAVPLRNC
jgi:hypothetical protein